MQMMRNGKGMVGISGLALIMIIYSHLSSQSLLKNEESVGKDIVKNKLDLCSLPTEGKVSNIQGTLLSINNGVLPGTLSATLGNVNSNCVVELSGRGSVFNNVTMHETVTVSGEISGYGLKVERIDINPASGFKTDGTPSSDKALSPSGTLYTTNISRDSLEDLGNGNYTMYIPEEDTTVYIPGYLLDSIPKGEESEVQMKWGGNSNEVTSIIPTN